MEKTQTQTGKSIRKPVTENAVYGRIRQDSKKEARGYVEGWRVPKGAE